MALRNVNTAVQGKSGKGKGWYMGYLIEQSNKPRVIWDKKGEHVGLAETTLTLTRDRWLKMEAKGPRNVWPDFFESYPSIRIDTRGLTPAQMRAACASSAAVVHTYGKKLWAVSEYHIFAPNGGSMGDCPEDLLVLHTDARTCQVDIFFDSQRPALVDTTVMSQANRRVGFGMDDTNDLKRTAGYFAATKVAELRANGISSPELEAMRPDALVPPARFMPYMPPMRCLHLDCDSNKQVIVNTENLRRRTTHHG